MTIYRGDRTIDGVKVTADGHPLDPQFQLKTLSTEGFEWGYEGAEPAQLALALLAAHYDDKINTLKHFEVFMCEIVANFANEWEMSSDDIDVALSNLGLKTSRSK